MSTPVCDFVRAYADSRPARLHMPGHKGQPILGYEPLDITEIDGADELYAASGIIAQSEARAGALFGAHTLYSAGGSTLCIQTMLHLLALHARERGRSPCILAGRNAHRAFLHAAALLDIEVHWLPAGESCHSCPVEPEELRRELRRVHPTAVYLTSPDYLGHMSDIAALAETARAEGVLLAVDNAHGAYLRFLPECAHPIALGAAICCDSAHKTLPVVTGGAYLHIAPSAPEILHGQAKTSMSLFGSSSPSYLILASLDAANDRMEDFRERLRALLPELAGMKDRIAAHGLRVLEGEPLKLTLQPKGFGYSGRELADVLIAEGIYPEFADPDFTVLMLSPYNTPRELSRTERVLTELPRRPAILTAPPPLHLPEAVCTPREALMAPGETVPVRRAVGRISAASVISCPPAIPLAAAGERIDEGVAEALAYYGYETCRVLKQR